MKKRLSVYLSAALAPVLLASCTANDPPVPDAADTASFFIKGELPDIGEYSGKNKAGLYSGDTGNTFIPSHSYGTLIPYIGRNKTFSSDFADQTYSFYGFVTAEGKIAMTASGKNTHITHNISQDGFEYYLLSVMPDEYVPDDYVPQNTVIIPSSGKWKIEIPAWSYVTGVNDGIISIMLAQDKSDGEQFYINPEKLVCYNYDGKELFSQDDVTWAGEFHCGLISVSGKNDEGYYINKNGEKVLQGFTRTSNFSDFGLASVADKEGSFLIDTKGNRITEKYNNVGSAEGGYFQGRTDSYTDIISPEGEVIKRINSFTYVGLDFTDSGIIYHYSGDYGEVIYKRLSDDTELVCEETGQRPNVYVTDGYFGRKLSDGSAVIFGYDGKTIAKLHVFNSLLTITDDILIYSKGDYEFGTGEDGTAIQTASPEMVIVDRKTGNELYNLGSSGSATFIGEGKRYLKIMKYTDGIVFITNMSYSLYDTAENKFIMEDLSELEYYEVGGKGYYATADSSFCTLYDEDFNILTRVINE